MISIIIGRNRIATHFAVVWPVDVVCLLYPVYTIEQTSSWLVQLT